MTRVQRDQIKRAIHEARHSATMTIAHDPSERAIARAEAQRYNQMLGVALTSRDILWFRARAWAWAEVANGEKAGSL